MLGTSGPSRRSWMPPSEFELSPDDVALVGGLVAIPSVSRNERDAVEWLVARMSERGFRATIDEAGNAVGEIGDGPRHVVLLGHIDTVPGDIPVRVEDGELVGRGAVDAKGPLAAFVAAASEPVAGLRVTVVGAVEEESPTSKGARSRGTPGMVPRPARRSPGGRSPSGRGSAMPGPRAPPMRGRSGASTAGWRGSMPARATGSSSARTFGSATASLPGSRPTSSR